MLRLWRYDAVHYNLMLRLLHGVLHEAKGVAVTRQINGDYSLTFSYPRGGRLEFRLKVGELVECEGQFFVITKISRSADMMYSVSCTHYFNYYAKKCHITNVAHTDTGDFIGEDAYKVLEEARNKSDPHMLVLLSEDEIRTLGMEPISVKIDFESIDKTNLYDVVQKVIECAGKGEIYVDNDRFAVVERLGHDTRMTISTAINMTGITVEKDISELVTRLYVYGKDNMTIAAAAKNEGGKVYINSPNCSTYGEHSGYKDFPDYTDPDVLLERALWEFDEDNPDRIDIPSVNISGSMLDLARIGSNVVRLNIGDGVRVVDGGENIYERVIELTRHPYEPDEDSISIGRVRKDMFFYLNQLGTLAKRYKDTSTYNGKIQGAKLSGTVSSGAISVRGARLTADAEGNLYLNGKKIITETEADE